MQLAFDEREIPISLTFEDAFEKLKLCPGRI
jgi:hypothetical protein